MKIENLGLPGRVTKRLTLMGVTTMEQLCLRTESDLLRIPGFGRGSLRFVTDVLASKGRHLKPRGTWATGSWDQRLHDVQEQGLLVYHPWKPSR